MHWLTDPRSSRTGFSALGVRQPTDCPSDGKGWDVYVADLAKAIAKVSYGDADGVVKSTAGKVKITKKSHRRTRQTTNTRPAVD